MRGTPLRVIIIVIIVKIISIMPCRKPLASMPSCILPATIPMSQELNTAPVLMNSATLARDSGVIVFLPVIAGKVVSGLVNAILFAVKDSTRMLEAATSIAPM